MLGLANALSGTATIVDRKYSAYFDGTGDYIDTGDTFQATLRADFSWSLWVKPDDGHPGTNDVLLGARNSSGEDLFYIVIHAAGDADAGKITIQHESDGDDASYKTDNAVFPNGACDWTHIAVRVNYTSGGADTSYNIYVNGYAVNGTLTNAVAHGDHADYTSDINFYIGGNNNNGSLANPFAGYIDEVALFRSHLSGAEIAAIYNNGRPFDLTNDLGDYDQASNLKAYWKMFDGLFDDRVKGIVHDNGISSGAPGYGTEMVTNQTFDNDTGWTISGHAGWAISGGTLTYTDDTGSSNYGYVDHLAHTDFTEGAVYKVEFDAIDTHTVLLYIKGATVVNQSCAAGHHVFYGTAGSSSVTGLRLAGNGTGHTGSIDNISLKKLNGFPGIASGNTTFNTSTPHTQAMSSVATFDGTGDYIQVGAYAPSGVINLNAISISCWIKTEGNNGNYDRIIDCSIGGGERAYRLMFNDADPDKISVGLWDVDDSSIKSLVSATATPVGQWYHVMVTFDGTTDANGVKLYVNNDITTDGAQGAASSDKNVNDNSSCVLRFGGSTNDANYFTGEIDEVAIWNVALDTDAVAAVYGAGRGYDLTADTGNYDNSSSLKGYWRMNPETPGSNVYVGHTDVIHDATGGVFGENLISNGDFETAGASETDATGWTPTAIAAHNERSSEYAFKGTYSWKFSSGGQITVNGATSGSTTAVFDDVTGAVAGMYLRTVSSGSLSGTSAHNEITNVNTDTKTLTFAGAQTLADDATVTFGMTNHGVQHDISGGVEAGKTYELSYWCYTVNPGGSTTTYAANNWINVAAGTMANIESGNNYGGAGGGSYENWFKVTNYFTCTTTDTSATIRLGNGGAAQPTTYYFDDVQFREVTGTPAYPAANATTIRQPV